MTVKKLGFSAAASVLMAVACLMHTQSAKAGPSIPAPSPSGRSTCFGFYWEGCVPIIYIYDCTNTN